MNSVLRNARGRFSVVGVSVVIVLLIAGGVYVAKKSAPATGDPYVAFSMEAFDSIQKNYWVKPGSFGQFNSPELPQLFQLALAKQGSTAVLATSTREGVAELIADALASATSTGAKKKLVVDTLNVVLYNLPPVGRDSLLSQEQVTALRQNVANVDPNKDLYKNLGVAKEATPTEIQQAYVERAADLAKATTTAAKEELKAVTYAHKVLTDTAQKELYDTQQVEPSVFAHTLGQTLYLSFNKIAPTTLQEFGRAIEAASTTRYDSLILDMRGNVGGALDFAKAFVGLFIGFDQYAYDLYHQGVTTPERTTIGLYPLLARYRDIAVLTDSQTQSTAELTTAALKRLRIAHAVGTKTRGWGSVENTYPLTTVIDPSTTYALLLVNSLTLRDDQQPIEQNGVLPDVDTSQSGWQQKLGAYFTSASLIAALRATATAAPLR